jgi:hypothetical protein
LEEAWRDALAEGELAVRSPKSESHRKDLDPPPDAPDDDQKQDPKWFDPIRTEDRVVIRPGNDRIGHLGIFLSGARGTIRPPQHVPELLEAVVSRTTNRRRDAFDKRHDTTIAGMLESAILDPCEGKTTVLNRHEGGYEERVLQRGARDTTGLLPGRSVPLAEVLREPSTQSDSEEMHPMAPET